MLSLRWNADELRRAIHEQIEQQIGTESDIDQKFDQAQAKVLTAETAEEAAPKSCVRGHKDHRRNSFRGERLDDARISDKTQRGRAKLAVFQPPVTNGGALFKVLSKPAGLPDLPFPLMVETPHSSIDALSEAVYRATLRSGGSPVSREAIGGILRSLYFASMRSEEGEAIACHVVYMDPNNPDPTPPERPPSDRWTSVAFGRPIPLNVATLVKIARASDPRTSSLAVHGTAGNLVIWGLVDQGNRYHDFINYDTDRGASVRPGVFQASIAGVGHIVAYDGLTIIAELRIDTLVTSALDVLREGPIGDRLQAAVLAFAFGLSRDLNQSQSSWPQWVAKWRAYLNDLWISTLSRLLLRIQSGRHGGAILLTPDTTHAGLNIKYQAEYRRLPESLRRRAAHFIRESDASDLIMNDYLDANVEEMPTALHVEQYVEMEDRLDAESEVDGALWFIALLSRVDGLVLMQLTSQVLLSEPTSALLQPDLTVKGFGVEITVAERPLSVFLAADTRAKRLRPVDYNHYGTRHRSMMQYCSQADGSIGFVVSQDGDVRVMTSVEGQLVMWENIRLRLPEYSRRRRRRPQS